MTPTSSLRMPRASAPDPTRLVGVKLGNYRLERLVGRGRMGTVYLAQDEALLRPTAIKILSWSAADARGQDVVQWFLAEARLVARINHPHVVQIYGAARHDGHCYIAMEYVAGDSAEALVAREGAMRPDRATDVLVQAASALHAAHRSGVVHRDVKPANLLLTVDGMTKLGDFGMALGCAEGALGTAHLRVGTPWFMAPELWRGEAATPASDLYALGATYFQLLTGRPPFAGRDLAEAEQGHLHGPIPDPRELVPSVPARCAELVARLLAKGARDRHASAQQLLVDAQSVLQGLGRHDRPAAAPQPAPSAAADRPPPIPRAGGAPPAATVHASLAGAFRFASRPFRAVDPADAPYDGEPFSAVHAALLASVEDDGAAVLALTGLPGSGRTTLARRVAAALATTRLVVSVEAPPGLAPRTLLQRLGAALDRSPNGPRPEITVEGLQARLAAERGRAAKRPVVVVDGMPGAAAADGETPLLVGALASAGCKVLLVGPPALGRELASAGVLAGTAVHEVAVPPLDRDQVAAYVQAWIDASRAVARPPILLTPDAIALLRMRSRGVARRVGVLAENMLLLAAVEGQRTLSSWHAWAASDRERWCETRTVGALPARPPVWPTPEAREAMDACRRDAGMPPWPPAEVRRR